MKKMFLPMLMLVSGSCFAQTPTRNCGTMEYYEMRKKSDPSFEKRMQENEILTQEWIKNHTDKKTSSDVSFPSLEGFTPTGNQSIDRINYANAKAIYLLKHPQTKNSQTNISADFDRKAREEKRKSNSIITK